MLKAGIDIGTNTILLLIAEVKDGRVEKVLEDHVTVVRLGQGVDKNRAFHPDALERARKCFRNYADILKKYPGISVKAVATSGSRDAKNSTEFFREIHETCGIKIDVISGEEEARYSFIGSVPDDKGDYAVLDIGGGSTEIVGKEYGSLFRHSFDLGCVRMTERFLKSDPVTPSELESLKSYVKEELGKKQAVLKQAGKRELIAVAGTATYLASTFLGLKKFDPDKVHMTELSLKDVDYILETYIPLTAKARIGLGGMDPGRADVIVAGAVILREVLVAAGFQKLKVSVRGLRYGLVL